MYAEDVEPRPAGLPRWARSAAVALVTAPAVLLAHLLTSGDVPSPGAVLLVVAVVACVARLLPGGGAGATAAVAALAQFAGHVALAVTVPGGAGTGGCLSVVGRGADALVDPAGACPPGTVAASPTAVALVTAVAAAAGAALLVLAGSGLVAAVTGVLVAVLGAGADAVRDLLAGLLPVLPDAAGVRLPILRTRPAPRPVTVRVRHLWSPATSVRRGPPAVSAAA
jgi:hypothetical protein